MKNTFLNKIKKLLIYDDSRRKASFIVLNAALALVSFMMSVINIFTAEYTLMISTLAFSILCVLNVLLVRIKGMKNGVYLCFGAEALALLAFFFISGIPDGFSALWICLIPSFALLIFGQKSGSMFCLVALIMMIFFFWIPAGQGLLQYEYSKTFMLRFPFLYGAIFGISLLVEYVRGETEEQLIEAEHKYRYLYRHDALTGLHNRYGINEYIDNAFHNPQKKQVAIMIMDIDDFKLVNDRYGHSAGDEVLKNIAKLPSEVLCEHCQFCRWGGEEFLVLMQCDHDPLEMAEKVRKKVEETATYYEDISIHVTISMGVCISTDTAHSTIAQVINQADRCLYEAKKQGKNQVQSYVME